MDFKCRNCPEHIRERCIQESSTSPTVKLMMHRAFDAGTDTQQMWGLLQMNCLLEQDEKAKPPPRPTLLAQRLKGESEPIEPPEGIDELGPHPPPVTRTPTPPPQPKRRPQPAREQVSRPSPTWRESTRVESALSRFCLALQGGERRIALPTNGEIVLGRFDPATKVTPDVDLSDEDRESFSISRRHARIAYQDGQHMIEDLGSTNGTMVNGERLALGQKAALQPGDHVTLGDFEFLYESIPDMRVSRHGPSPLAYILVTFTGHKFPLPSWGEVIIGRSDRTVGLFPDIDLGDEDCAAEVVARRHVKIIARGGRHYLEDLGSASGTKLNGVPITIGERGLLEPGDHLWLGGYVLAYDIERPSKKTDSGSETATTG